MYTITNWLKEIAAVEHGYDPQKQELSEFLYTNRTPQFEALDRIAQLRGASFVSSEQFKQLLSEARFFQLLERGIRSVFVEEYNNAGVKPLWVRRDVQESMTTAHFTQYFADAVSRAFYHDYNYMPGSWVNYTYQDTAPDFRGVKRFRMTEPETLLRRRENAEAKPTAIHEYEIEYAPEEFARQFEVSWQALMNDDLGKIRETPQRMARAARRFEDEFVSNLYDNSTTQATLSALGAPWAITGRLTAANLAIGINAMMSRTDAAGNPLRFNRIYLVIPPILQITAMQILQDVIQYGGPNSNVLGTWIAGVFVDPYIATDSPNVPWYLFADPAEVPAVSVVRLQGLPGPVVYQKSSDIQMISGSAPAAFLMGSFDTGDIKYAVEDIIGGAKDEALVGVTDFRGILYSSGTTP